MPVPSAVHGLGQESVLVGYGGEQSHGSLNVHEVHVDGHGLAHVFEVVWKTCVKKPEIDGHPSNDWRLMCVWALCHVGRFSCGYVVNAFLT